MGKQPDICLVIEVLLTRNAVIVIKTPLTPLTQTQNYSIGPATFLQLVSSVLHNSYAMRNFRTQEILNFLTISPSVLNLLLVTPL